MKQTLVLFFISTITFFACRQGERITPVLTLAEKLMADHPDSALTLLDDIPFPDNYSNREYATWCLLITQARDKNYVAHTSDSLISIAVDYFENGSDMKRKAQAYYYKGRVNEDIGEIDKALENYLKARDYVVETDDYHLRGLIFMYIGDLHWLLADNRTALNAYKDSFAAFGVEADFVNSAYLLRSIGRVYTAISQLDSAEIYLKRSLDLSKQVNKQALQGYIENDLAILYKKIGNNQEALKYAYSSIEHTAIKQSLYSNYLMIGSLFYKIGENDSSFYYTKRALGADDLYTLAAANDLLATIYEERNDYVQATKCLSAYINYYDSIKIQYDAPKLKELEMRYNTEKTEHENERLLADQKIMQLLITTGFCFGLFLAVSGYLIYQKRLKRKEQFLQQALEAVKNYQDKYEGYQKEIECKELQIHELQECVKEKENALLSHEGEILTSSNLEQELDDLHLKIDGLKNNISVLSKKNSDLIGLLLDGSQLKADVEEAVGKNQSITPLLFLGIQQKIKEVDPDFMKKIEKAAPGLKLKELQLCCLIKLNVSLSQCAVLLQIEKRTISRYKSVLVKERFGRQDNMLLDNLLRSL